MAKCFSLGQFHNSCAVQRLIFNHVAPQYYQIGPLTAQDMSHLHHFKEQKNRLHPYTDYRPAPASGAHPPATDILSHFGASWAMRAVFFFVVCVWLCVLVVLCCLVFCCLFW